MVFAASPLIPQTPIEMFINLSPLATVRALFAHILAGIMGIGASLVAVPLQSMVHEMIPESNRGRVMGIQFTLLSTASTLPAVIAGVGADLFGVVPIFIGMSIPLLLISARGFYHWLNKQGDVDASTDW